jgi:drug/metabolite transporter, DME family
MSMHSDAAVPLSAAGPLSSTAQQARRTRATGYVLALAAGTMWGTTGLVSELLSRSGVEVTAIGFWRVLLGTLGFLVYGAFRPSLFRVDRRGVLLAGVVGGILVALFEVAFQFGFKHLGVAPTVALLYTAPVMITLLAGPVLGERVTPLRLLLAALTAVGVFLTVTGGEGIKASGNLWIGLAGAMGAAVSYAGTTLLARYTVPRYGSERVLFLEIAGGTLVLAVVLPLVGASPVEAGWVPAWMHSPTAWVQVVALGIVTVVLANFAFFGAAKRIDAAPTAVGASCEPVVGALLALVFLGQHLAPIGWLGLALVVSGVAGGYLRESGGRSVERDEGVPS